jgi:hypothetical protein
MMKVIKLTWLSKEAKEAELIVSDGNYKCVVFSHPCEVSEGDLLKEPLHAFIVKDLMISNDQNYFMSTIKPGRLSHRCVAKVVDENTGLVKIGNINILLDEKLPMGTKSGDFIEFICVRLDLW